LRHLIPLAESFDWVGVLIAVFFKPCADYLVVKLLK
jgi:hypothetical protein